MNDYKNNIISLVQKAPLLWDPMHADYKNKDQRKQVWEKIEEKVPPPGEGVNAKDTWTSLTRSYNNALQRLKTKSGDGAGSSKPWVFMKNMSFLKAVKEKRSTTGNLDSSHGVDQDLEESACSIDDSTNILEQAARGSGILDDSSDDEDILPDLHVPSRASTRTPSRASTSTHSRASTPTPTPSRASTPTPSRASTPTPSRASTSTHSPASTPTPSRASTPTPSRASTPTPSRASTPTPSRASTSVLRPTSNESVAKQRSSSKRRAEESEAMLFQSLQRRLDEKSVARECPRMGFFKSLMPKIQSLTDDQFIEFQLKVLTDLKEVTTCSTQPVLQPIYYQQAVIAPDNMDVSGTSIDSSNSTTVYNQGS